MNKAFFFIITIATLLTLPAKFVAGASPNESLAKRKPEVTIDLATKQGVEAVKGAWRYSETKIVEVDFKAAGGDGQPTGAPNKAYDFTPHAGGADFDDSKWEVIDPTTLDKRRSSEDSPSTGTGSRSPSRSESAISIQPAQPWSSLRPSTTTLKFGWMENCRALPAKAAVQSSKVGTRRTG